MSSILDRHLARFRADPADRRAFEALEEGYFVAANWKGLRELYEQRLAAPDLASASRERARVLFRLGQVCAERFGDDHRASKYYRQAVAADGNYRPPLSELRRIHVARAQWVMVLQIAEAEALLEMPPADSAELFCQLGEIWLNHLFEPESALEHYQRALESDPTHAQALEGAARAAHELGRPGEAARFWERCAGHSQGSARARALIAQAGLLIGVLGAPTRAAELYAEATREDPENRDAVDALAALAEAGNRWEELAQLQERRFELCPEPELRGAIALATGRLHLDQLGNPELARQWLTQAAELGVADATLYRALADLERERGDDPALRSVLEQLVSCSGDRVSVSALLELATLYSDGGDDGDNGDDAGALSLLNRALTQAPDDGLVVEALCDTLSRLGHHDELVDALERRAALSATDPSQCAAALAELGALHERELGDLEAARQAYERGMMADPETPGVAESLERIYRKTEAWNELRGLLDQVSRGGRDDFRTGKLCALGELLMERFDDSEAACRAFDSALSLDFQCAAAHRGRQRLATASGDEDRILETHEGEASTTSDARRLATLVPEIARVHERRGDASRALEWTRRWIGVAPDDPGPLRLASRLQEQLGLDDELLDTLERLDPLLQSHAQAENRSRIAALHTRHGRQEEAIAAHRRALDVAPTDVESLRALDGLLETAGRPEELAGVRRRLAELVTGTERVACLDAMSRLLEERLGDLPAAIDTLAELVACEGAPADAEDRLDALLDRSARHEELAARLALRADGLPPESDAAHELRVRRGLVLLEHLSRFDEAAETYRQALQEHPDSEAARAGLERSLRASGDSAGLAEYLAERIDGDPDPEARDRFALERAVIQEEILDAPDAAVESYRRLSVTAQRVDDRMHASGRLERLLERAEDWPGLREHLERVLETVEGEERAPLLERLAQLCRDRLDDPDAALLHFEETIQLAPDRPEPWRALAPLYEAAGRSEDLARVLERELDNAADADRELDLRRRAAALYSGELADPDRSASHFERILELDPADSSAAEFLVQRFETQERPEEIARILEQRLAALDAMPRDEADEPEAVSQTQGQAAQQGVAVLGEWTAQRTSLRRRIAGLRAGVLDDPDGAIAALEPALAEIGARAVVAEPLADLYQSAGYLDDLIPLCRRAVAEGALGHERAGWFTRLGTALRQRGDDEEAADAWRQVLAERPDDDDAKAALRGLYRKLREGEPLARLLEAELEDLAGPPEVPLRMELAGLFAGSLQRPVDALGHLRRVVHVDPSHAAALTRGLELAEELQHNEVVLELLDLALDRAQVPTQRAALLTRRARVLAELPERVDDSVEAYRDALRLAPGRNDVRAALRRLLEARGRYSEVLDCLLVEAARSELEPRAQLYEEAADLAWQQVSAQAALPWLERLRQLRPRDAQVAARISEAHRSAGNPAQRVRALERQTTLAPDAVSKRDLALERARVLETELHESGRALAALEEARELCPEDAQVLRELDRLYRKLGRHRERAAVLEKLCESAQGPDRVSLQCEAATLCSGPLGEPSRAAELLELALEETPRASALHVELLRTVGEALRATGDTLAWTRSAEAELAALDPGSPVFDDRRFELQRELALAHREAGHLDASLHHLRRVVDAAPEGFDTSGELERALLEGLRAQGNPVELERRLAHWLDRHPGSASEWLELAHLREEQLRSTSGAAEAYRRALDCDPGCVAAMRGLRAAAERLGDWEQVAAMLQSEVDCGAPLPTETRSELLRRLADIAWTKLESTTRASRTYATALEADPEDFAAHRSFEQLLEAVEDWRGALDLYESEAQVLGERDPERRTTLWLRVGEIARDHTDEPERALRAYVNAAQISELDLDRRRERAELHLRCGEHETFAEVFADWCDEAAAGAEDQVRLAGVLEQLDRSEQALARLERAIEIDAACLPAWQAAARLREAAGDVAGAGQALTSAAELAEPGDAADHLLRAAQLCAGAGDAQACVEMLRRAVVCDPGRSVAQAELALAAVELGAHSEAEEAAGRALALDGVGGELGQERRRAVAVAGGRAAQARERLGAAADFYERALEIEPRDPDALAGAGETHALLGDLAKAREVLAARLELAADNPAAALHYALLARCVAGDDPEQALSHCEAALTENPEQLDAHELRAELLEAAGRRAAGIEALDAWSKAAAPEQRAEILERAARWELAAGDRLEAAEAQLCRAVEADASLASAQLLLAELLRDQERSEELVERTGRALESVEDSAARRQLALLRAEALEQDGDRTSAAKAYAIAAEADPGCLEAATARARLLRGAGDWRGAAEALEEFVDSHPGGDAEADACVQLGRLRAGPLEDLEGAIRVYRRAVELRPQDLDLRTTLADLLGHRPDDRAEALAHHRQALEAYPVHLPSLRAGLRAALESGNDAAAGNGLVLMRALGVATPEEVEAAPERLTLQLAAAGVLDDPLSETLRQAVLKVSRELASALAAPEAQSPIGAEGAIASFRAAALEAEAALTAPGLLPLPTEELGELLTFVAALALEVDETPGSGSTLNAVSAELGRRARRRVRRVLEGRSFAEIRELDFAAWRREVRVLAAARAVDEAGCDLRTALLARIGEHSEHSVEEIGETADLTPLVAACPEALSLVRRAVRAWLQEV